MQLGVIDAHTHASAPGDVIRKRCIFGNALASGIRLGDDANRAASKNASSGRA